MRDAAPPGDRLRELRLGAGLTQEGLAERADLSLGVVKKLERGGNARIETYHALARALGVRTSTLFEPSGPRQDLHADDHPIDLMPLRQAISPPVTLAGRLDVGDVDEGGDEPDLARLRRTAKGLAGFYINDDYPLVAKVLPALVRSAHLAVQHFDTGAQGNEALRIRSDVLQMAGRYLTQVRAYDLAHLALRDAVRDAAAIGDRLAAAAAVTGQGWTLVRQGRFDEAEQLTAMTAEELEPRLSRATRDELAVWGRLLRRSSSAAARNNRPQEARELLRLARAAAVAIGETPAARLYGWNRFDQLRVGLQAIENHMVARRPDRVLGLAERIRVRDASDSATLRRHQLTVAQAHALVRHDADALGILEVLHGQAPEWLRHQRIAADVFRDVRRLRQRPLSHEQRALGQFLGVH